MISKDSVVESEGKKWNVKFLSFSRWSPALAVTKGVCHKKKTRETELEAFIREFLQRQQKKKKQYNVR